jgi:hypothetical protein
MIHQSEIKNYPGTMEELVEEIGNLKYDALSKFLELLANKIHNDGEKDKQRNRVKLSRNLFNGAEKIRESRRFIDQAWIICKPFTI